MRIIVMKSGVFRSSAVLLILLFVSAGCFAQEEGVTEKDRKFYLYSIDQLSAANQDMQDQLAADNELIDQLRAELDSLRSEIIAIQAEAEAGGGYTSSPSPAAPIVSIPASESQSLSYEEAYRKALEKFNQRDYKKAITMFQALIERSMTNAVSDNCQYWIGECYYGLRDYQKAVIEFEKVFSFSNTNKDDDAQLKLGMSYIRLDQKENARRELTRLLSNYPDSEFTALARKLLEEL